jgi:hypothetical protein
MIKLTSTSALMNNYFIMLIRWALARYKTLFKMLDSYFNSFVTDDRTCYKQHFNHFLQLQIPTITMSDASRSFYILLVCVYIYI